MMKDCMNWDFVLALTLALTLALELGNDIGAFERLHVR